MTASDFQTWVARRPVAILALAALAAVAAFLPSIRGPFLFDDLSEIVNNPAIRTLLPPWRPMFEGGELPHRPIPYLSFAANYQWGVLAAALFGAKPLDPLPFHAVNIAIHLVNGWLLYRIVRQLLMTRPPAGGSDRPTAVIAAVAAAVWLVHPLQSQAVSYVYQRIELLAALASLATCAAFLMAAASVRPLPWITTAVVACGLGMACKEWVIVVPPVILLLDRAFLANSWREVFARRGVWHLALFATWPILFAIVATQLDRYPETGFSMWQSLVYAANQPVVILWYLSRLVLPVGLSIDHGAELRKELFGRDAWLLVPAVGAVATAAWAAWSLPRRPATAFLILAFLLLLAPTSSILPVHDVCVEHRMYLASAIPITAAVVAIACHSQLLLPVAATAIVVFAALTAARNTVYQSPLTAWRDAVEKSAGSSRSLSRLGTELSRLNHHEEAVSTCATAVKRDSANPVPYAALAAALLNANQPEQAAAVSQAGLATNANVEARFGDPVIDRLDMYLGISLHRIGDPRGEELLRAAVERRPDSLVAKEHLARALVQTDPQAAAALWSSIAAAAPNDPYAVFNLGSVVARFDAASAIDLLTRAIELDPTNPDAHNNLGNAFLILGRHDAAIAAYRRCLDLAPGHPLATANLRMLESGKQ